jgi:large subunit ribosomal protein L19
VRKVTSGVGVEKSYLLHSPLVEKIVVTKRSKVRRNSLNYLRYRRGKGERLKGTEFDREAVNEISEVEKSEVETKTESETEAESKNDK